VLVVEDTSTTGSAVLTAIDAITEFGAQVVGVSLLLDRGGLASAMEARGVVYRPVLGAPDLGYEYGS
jgi:orotate phosphoribosyltransferase